jgi:hypothetical protein
MRSPVATSVRSWKSLHKAVDRTIRPKRSISSITAPFSPIYCFSGKSQSAGCGAIQRRGAFKPSEGVR